MTTQKTAPIIDEPLNFPARLALVVSRFNPMITEKLLEGALERIRELSLENETVVWVPGAVEIPLIAQHLARTSHYHAIIALGAVIRGETSHYDYVCQQVSNGCQQVSLGHHIPVIFGVLTTENEQQAKARCGGEHGHKGRESVDAAYQMIALLSQLT